MRAEYREEPSRSALNRVVGMDFGWSLNPYTGCVHRCTFCYVRGFEQRADRPSDDRYGRAIRVKTNVVDVLRRELIRPSWRRELVAIGAATDPYQPIEGRYRLTRGCLRVLAAARTPFSIVTRSPLIVRDVDVLRHAAGQVKVSVSISIPAIDDRVWRTTEPGTAPPHQRFRALRTLVDAGIRAGIGLAPILPGLSDNPRQIEAVLRAARDAGATFVWCNLLYLKPGTREHFLGQLARDWPTERARYDHLYQGAYLDRRVSDPVRHTVARLAERLEIADRRPLPLTPPSPPEQLPLAI
jgi:DNA repair photolyase